MVEASVPTHPCKKIRYIIIGSARSGTTVMHLALMGHPNICALNDELKVAPFFTGGISTFTYGNDLDTEKQKGYSALFDALTMIRANSSTIAHGMKTVCNSKKLAETIVDVLQKHLQDVKVIVVFREDLVAQYASAESARKTGIMHSWYKGFGNRTVSLMKVNRWRFIAYALSVLRMYGVLAKLKKTHDVLEVRYEDMLKDAEQFYANLFSFLELRAMEPTWLTSKKVMPPPEDYIDNYAAMRKQLERIKSGTLPAHIIFLSKTVNYLYWQLNRFVPFKNQRWRKKKKRLLSTG